MAAEWLSYNEGDGGEAESCKRVAEWLLQKSADLDLRETCKERGVPVRAARKAMEKTA